MPAPNFYYSGLRAALMSALGLSACTGRALDDLGAGDPATTGATAGATDPGPGSTTVAPTTGGPGGTGSSGGVDATGGDTTTSSDTTAGGDTTTMGVSTTTGAPSETTTGADISTSGTTVDATSDTTGIPDLPCTPVAEVGVVLEPAEANAFPGCEQAMASICHDYIKICAPRPDGADSCEACAPDCVGGLPTLCDAWIRLQSVCGPFAEGEQCCHVFEHGWNCADGRPFCVDGEARVATLRDGAAWTGREAPALLAELDANQRAGLAALWVADGLAEHASVASFARFTLQLLALGAPAELVEAACRAQLDEVGHARTALALAAAYGSKVGPGPLAVDGALAGVADREAVLVATFIEGCVGETIAAAELELAAQACVDPVVAAALRSIAADEQRHATLAWRTVQWLLHTGGAALRGALTAALAGVVVPAPAIDELPATLMRRHGRTPAGERVALARHCLHAVIRPCALALLSAQDGAGELVRSV
jgi:hypothetical protein